MLKENFAEKRGKTSDRVDIWRHRCHQRSRKNLFSFFFKQNGPIVKSMLHMNFGVIGIFCELCNSKHLRTFIVN